MKDPPGLLPNESTDGSNKEIFNFFYDSWSANRPHWVQERIEGVGDQPTVDARTNLDGEFQDFEGVLWGQEVIIVDEEHSLSEETKIFYLKHLPSGRPYVLIDANGSITALPTTQDSTTFKELWANADPPIVAAQLAYFSKEEKNTRRSSAEYVSREPLLWRSEWARIHALSEFGDELKTYAESVVKEEKAVRDRWWESADAAESDYRKYAELTTRTDHAKLLKQRLSSEVAEKGYLLALKDDSYPDPRPGANPPAVDIKEGEIYRKTSRIVEWTTSVTVIRSRTIRGRSGSRMTITGPVRETRHHSAVKFDFELINFEEDPVEVKKATLEKLKKNVYVFRLGDGGYVTAFGERLKDIVALCQSDEVFREKCVIVLPEYSPFVSGADRYLGATFYYNPLPSQRATRFPVLAFKESLSYSVQWVRSELGQLVQSINLAPGEERAIEISTSYEEEVSSSSSFRAVNEFSSERGLDLSTEIENEAVKEHTKTRQKSASASASGSFGGFGASGAVSGSSTESLKNYSRQLTKVARRAVQKINRKMSQEVASSSARKVSISSSVSRTLEISNINQGRTLNILFYQINNVFKGGAYLDDIEISIVPGTELIAGSGVFDVKTYKLHELDEALVHFLPENLPLEVKLDDTDLRSINKYWSVFLDALVNTIYNEYAVGSRTDVSSLKSIGLAEFDLPIETFQVKVTENEDGTGGNAHWRKENPDIREWLSTNIKKKYDEVKEVLESLRLRTKPIEPIEMMVASGGLYVDSLLGTRPATEPYSERMRELEAERALAETKLINARAQAIAGASPRRLISELTIEGEEGDKRVRLRFIEGYVGELDRVELFFEGQRIADAKLQSDSPTGKTAYFRWPADAELPSIERLKESFWLVDGESGLRSFYAGLTEG
ncbi:hypothetical protein OAF27_02375 [Verrucomicrobiales bacterium]|nr:hypothetical protein [Verrucomicrobiales bacterium]